jgi:antitoxin VapB
MTGPATLMLDKSCKNRIYYTALYIKVPIMALSIKNQDVDRLARELARTTGESLTEAILKSLKERLLRERGRSRTPRLKDELRAIRERCAALPVLDPRTPDEILGFDERGIPR